MQAYVAFDRLRACRVGVVSDLSNVLAIPRVVNCAPILIISLLGRVGLM